MRSKVARWGGSCAVRLPKMAVESLGLREGQEIDLRIEDGALVIRPEHPVYRLDDLVREARRQEPPEVLDDGPAGREIL
ncbi:AbrB/MazE/SpoVT family DNA-binding domain-containing protein [Marinibaculum pumilum]|uniref:AbrB/MazE/SpoVT family DNA-binding domain-containing protein n=1 Tax=Marinibaculum pumilum TaxID=1766165 RepID=A0ABV7L9S4_9PROT